MKIISIVGMKYIDKKFNLNQNLQTNEKIILKEEENNKYDKNAIAAYYFNKDDKLVKFGYVAKNDNDGTIDLTNVYNTREEDDTFDFMDNEEENDFWDTLFNDFFW